MIRTLDFKNEDDVLRDLRNLRAGETHQGKWTLAQTCWHCARPLVHCLKEPATLTPTPEQAQMQSRLAAIRTGRSMPAGLPIPAGTDPLVDMPGNVGDAAIDEFIRGLHALKSYGGAYVDFGPFGPVSTDVFRDFVVIHTAHHFGYFKPTGPSRRDGLSYADEDACIADVQNLRRGHIQTGNWSLPQVCWHLEYGVQLRMKPGPYTPNLPEQDARKPMLEQTLATGRLPNGIVAPDLMLPPRDLGENAIDSFITILTRFKTFAGPIAPHRLFGHLSDADARRLNLIHCAHHLSYLIPTNAT